MKNVKQSGVVAYSVPAAEMGAYQHSAPPTDTFIDNMSIQSLVSGENGKGKALRSYNRVISHLRSLKREQLTNPIGIPTLERLTDIGTKQYKNATAF